MKKARFQRHGRGLIALATATAVWIPCLHFFFAREVGQFNPSGELSPMARRLAARQLLVWSAPGLRQRETARLRRGNPEWDLMARSFVVWSLAEMGLRNPPARREYLGAMDGIIDDTLTVEREQGIYFCLGHTAKDHPYVVQPPRNQFLDGEVALMLAYRCFLEDKPAYRTLLRDRLALMTQRMQQSPLLSAESYPDECWIFDNVIALCAMRLADCLDGTDHSQLTRQWLGLVKEKLVDRGTGLLVTSYTTAGRVLKGPEATSIWMVAHCLRLLDENFAQDQYRRARKEFGRTLAGFAWSRKTPADSASILPSFQIGAGASGMALIGASAFGDVDYLSALEATLDFSAFPSEKDGRLHYCAGNQLGDAVMLYASVLGPLWERGKHQANHE